MKLTLYRGYRRSLGRQTSLDRGLKSKEEVRLLTALLCYLMKGLIQRPDDMSSSREMVRRLQVTVRAEVQGFPSLQPALLSDCLTRIDGEPDAGQYRILNYLTRFKPSGARLKSTRAQHVGGPDVVDTGDSEEDTVNQHAKASAQLPKQSAQGPGLTIQDEKWVHTLVNSTLPRWLWHLFPGKDRKRPVPLELLEGPLRFRNWGALVRDTITYKTTARNGSFQTTIDNLFPPDWQFKAHNGAQWKNYQSAVLDPVIARLELQSDQHRRQYSEALRRSIVHQLKFWEFLPVGWKHKVWSYTGGAAQPVFGLAANPTVSK
jgi:hypothetical protein